MKTVHPYLNFAGNTEEAFRFYRQVFGGDFMGIMRFRDMGDESMNIPPEAMDQVAHIALPMGGGTLLMGTDSMEPLTMGNNVYLTVDAESAEEAERLFDGLAAGGRIEMPLERTSWAEKYGICVDRYGVQWMVNYDGDVQFSPPTG
jgi:PhnB protein